MQTSIVPVVQRGHLSVRNMMKPGFLGGLGEAISGVIDRATALSHLDRLYQALPPIDDDREFLRRVLETFDVRMTVEPEEIDRLPSSGPAIVVANHPFGAIEGVAIAALLRERRSDVRVLANHLLGGIAEIAHLFIRVDPFGGETAARRNLRPLREAIRHVERGGLLAIFPAGEVAHFNLRQASIVDPKWHPSVATIARRSRAPVVPVFFHGHNRALFHLAGMLHPRLRTALLARELLARAHLPLRIRIGNPVAFDRLAAIGDDEAITSYLRVRTYLLGGKDIRAAATGTAGIRGAMVRGARRPRRAASAPAVAEAPAPALLKAEIEALPRTQLLVETGEMRVVYARTDQIPWLLREIGRLRELTFRAVGEGTGRAADIDAYDDHYLHFILWNATRNEVAGGYRIGLVDEILRHHGMAGLYTRSLFRYTRRLLDSLPGAMELGRSFVRVEYQRSYAPLLTLWKGIGRFVVANPRYCNLFGPVSISNDYHPLSRQLLVEYVHNRCREGRLARHVRPRRPFRGGGELRPHRRDLAVVPDLDALNEMLCEIDGRGAPILLRHYLGLGGRVLGFNVDPDFGNALDGLIAVDLRRTAPKMLERYMGRDGAAAFLAFHNGN